MSGDRIDELLCFVKLLSLNTKLKSCNIFDFMMMSIDAWRKEISSAGNCISCFLNIK